MSTKNRIHDGLFRVKLMAGSIVLGGFVGVLLYLHYLNAWTGMTLVEIWRGFRYVYDRAPDALGIAAFGGSFTLGYLAWLFAWRPGAARPGDADTDADNLRGQSLLTAAEIKKMLKRVTTRLEIGGVPIPIAVEDRGFLLAGAPGTGKSHAITRILDKLQADAHRVVIADASGIFYARYANADAVLINPLDRRGVAWSPLAEIEKPSDCAGLARSIIPDGTGAEQSWNDAAQAVLEGLLRRCWERGLANADLYRLACTAETEELQGLLAGTAAMAVVANARYFGEVRPGLGRYLRCFEHLDPGAGRDSFSLRRYIDEGAGWVFVTYAESERDALRPLIQCALDVASRAVLCLPPARGDRSAQRRTWFVLDELPLLGRISSLVPLLTNGSKHGAAVIAGLQTVAQLRDTYGDDQSQTILATLGTWLTLRVGDAETSDYMSQTLGDEEIRRVIRSGGKNDSGKSENWSEQHTTRRVVMPSQLQNLGNLCGYLNIAGDLPACAVTLPLAEQREPAASAFEPAPLRETTPVPPPPPPAVDANANANADADLPAGPASEFTLN